MEIKAGYHRIRYLITRSLLRHPINWWQHRGLHETDVFVGSYPKSGTTWLRFMLVQLLGTKADSFEQVNQSCPGVGYHWRAPILPRLGGRLIQTHEPVRKEYVRAIYIARDGRDVMVSELFQMKRLGLLPLDFPLEQFVDPFLEGRVNRYGAWHEHVQQWKALSVERPDQVLFLRFEDLKENAGAALQQVSAFLGLSLGIDYLEQMVQDNNFERMRARDQEARKSLFSHHREEINFVRKGKAGGWREVLGETQRSHFEAVAGEALDQLGYLRSTVLSTCLK